MKNLSFLVSVSCNFLFSYVFFVFCFVVGRGLTIVGSILEGDFKERADDVALAKEVRDS